MKGLAIFILLAITNLVFARAFGSSETKCSHHSAFLTNQSADESMRLGMVPSNWTTLFQNQSKAATDENFQLGEEWHLSESEGTQAKIKSIDWLTTELSKPNLIPPSKIVREQPMEVRLQTRELLKQLKMMIATKEQRVMSLRSITSSLTTTSQLLKIYVWERFQPIGPS